MTGYEELAELAKAAEASKGRSRDLAANAQAAKTKVDDRYKQLVEAHANYDEAKVKAAKKAHATAKDELEARAAEAQGAELRAARDELAVGVFKRDNADRLLEEKRESAEQTTSGLVENLRACLQPHHDWHRHAQEINELVRSSGKGDPRQDCPNGHGFESLIHAIDQALASVEVASPMPHYRHVRFLEQQQLEAEQRARVQAA
jgi:hypothetical protein